MVTQAMVISEEGKAVLDEIEPKPWKVELEPQFWPKDWAEVPYMEAMVGRVQEGVM
jgi:hypothetical protein